MFFLAPNGLLPYHSFSCWRYMRRFGRSFESMQPFFIVTNRERFLSLCLTAYVVILIPALVIAAHTSNVEAVAMTRTAITTLFSLVMLSALVAVQAFDLRTLIGLLWRPLVAVAVMGGCVSAIDLPAAPIIVLFLRVTQA